ncbi:hypothetical protein BJ138DRAFT_1158953 [Hygrophoropsis aurantiaca]|uniref:Uncharacterized protein n=1 Tax=Hygrophoropsis aurantiaca TaxID=72124 RepID=A0ACB8A492_9AGAM|nr:hypothetical protein BJ138DRAFT_1158953 [Hygrophoropsis aurantiaca]
MVSPFTIASRRAEDDRPEIRIRVEIDSESTGDFPRESLARIAVNYAPSAVMVLGFVVYTAVASYLWLHATYSWIGGWTLLPVGAVSVSALVALVAFGRRVRAVVAAG